MTFQHFASMANTVSGPDINAETSRKRPAPRTLIGFLNELDSHGIAVTNGPAFTALYEYTPEARPNADPFTATPAELHKRVTEDSLRAGDTGTRMSRAWDAYVESAARVLLASMRTEADTYIDTLRGPFDTAAATITDARAQGITWATGNEWVMNTAAPEQVAAYRAARDAAQVLDRIARTRVGLSAWLGVAPQTNAPHRTVVSDYTPAFVRDAHGFTNDQVAAGQVANRWLDLAGDSGTELHLASIAELHEREQAARRASLATA